MTCKTQSSVRLSESDYFFFVEKYDVFNKFDDSPFNIILKILYIKNDV